MTDRERARDRKPNEEEATEETESVESATDGDALDELLDEIDAVLEENAEEFVKNYVQKGGQ